VRHGTAGVFQRAVLGNLKRGLAILFGTNRFNFNDLSVGGCMGGFGCMTEWNDDKQGC